MIQNTQRKWFWFSKLSAWHFLEQYGSQIIVTILVTEQLNSFLFSEIDILYISYFLKLLTELVDFLWEKVNYTDCLFLFF